MKRQAWSGWGAVFGLCVLIGYGQPAHAATQTTAQVELTPSTDERPVPPVDPEQPDRPYPGDPTDPDNETGTGAYGQLTIDFVSNVHFQTTTAKTGPQTLTAANQRAMIQVSDRRARPDGWTLQVTASPLRSQQRTLASTLTLGSVQLTPGKNNVSAAPQLLTTGEIRPGVTANVVTAPSGSGLGTWLVSLNRGPTPVQLHLYEHELEAGRYTGNLAWSLTNAPA